MIKLLVRIAMFFIGAGLLLDIGLPTRIESLRVDQHTSTDRRSNAGSYNRSVGDTSYKLHLVGGRVSTCSVGFQTYETLKDGDTVNVKATKISRKCIQIMRGEEVIESDKHWKIIALVMGCLFIAAAVGLLKDSADVSNVL